MTRGRRPTTGLDDAFQTALMRGTVMKFFPESEIVCNFLIQNPASVIFVCIRYASRLHGTLQEIETEFRELIVRLRSIPGSGPVIRELWLYSRYGTWRYFRIRDTGIEEISREGISVTIPEKEPVVNAGKMAKEGTGITLVQG
jgi:hypothetical protein